MKRASRAMQSIVRSSEAITRSGSWASAGLDGRLSADGFTVELEVMPVVGRIEARQELRHRHPRPLPPDDDPVLHRDDVHGVADAQPRGIERGRR